MTENDKYDSNAKKIVISISNSNLCLEIQNYLEGDTIIKQLSDYEPYKNYYHFVGSAKYRKNLFYSEDIRLSLQKMIQEILEKKGIEVVEVTVAYNHVHVLLRSELPPSQIGQTLFGASSRLLRKEYPLLVQEAGKSLWGGTSWKVIRDEAHLEHCRSYIQRHLTDNTKLEEAM